MKINSFTILKVDESTRYEYSMQTYHVFNSLEGNWKLYRTLSNNGMMSGTAAFIRCDLNELFYRETGLFVPNTNAHTFKVYREYFYCYMKNQIHVFHAENNKPTNLLHTLEFITNSKATFPLQAQAHHVCSQDSYQALYSFFATQFQLQYKVKGPKKNYTITTIFDRIEIE